MSNVNGNQNDKDEQSTINAAKLDINAWRKRRSLENAQNPLLQRRLSQGEINFYLCVCVL